MLIVPGNISAELLDHSFYKNVLDPEQNASEELPDHSLFLHSFL